MHHADGISPEREGEPMAEIKKKGAGGCSVKAQTEVKTLVRKTNLQMHDYLFIESFLTTPQRCLPAGRRALILAPFETKSHYPVCLTTACKSSV